jgi:hypothetical protein
MNMEWNVKPFIEIWLPEERDLQITDGYRICIGSEDG